MVLELQTETTSLSYLQEAITRYGVPKIAGHIGLHANTVARWIDQQTVPPQYISDLARLIGKTEFGCEVDKDQYFTKPQTAQLCMDYFNQTMRKLEIGLDDYLFIEPSMGAGGFYDLLPPFRRVGIDIDPVRAETIRSNYLEWQPTAEGKYIVIGNPPFGLRGHRALQFINHSLQFADVVAFILPQLFESDGKGVPAKRVNGYKLAESIRLAPDSFQYPNGDSIDIHALFQVWTKINIDKIPSKEKNTCNQFIRVLSLSDGGTPASTRNKAWLNHCDVYLPSTTFQPMRAYDNFEELPHRRGYGVVIHQLKDRLTQLLKTHDWDKTAFMSTNSARNLRKSLIESVVIDAGYTDW